MQGVRFKVVDIQVCVVGEVGINYFFFVIMDINFVISCLISLVIVDVFLEKQNDIFVGNVKYCCRNGIILLVVIDFFKFKFVFMMNVFKFFFYVGDLMYLVFLFNFRIGDGVYMCGVF